LINHRLIVADNKETLNIMISVLKSGLLRWISLAGQFCATTFFNI